MSYIGFSNSNKTDISNLNSVVTDLSGIVNTTLNYSNEGEFSIVSNSNEILKSQTNKLILGTDLDDVDIKGAHFQYLPEGFVYASHDMSMVTNISVKSKRSHTMVLDSKGYVYATGTNNVGQLGLGDFNDRNKLTKLDINNVSAIEANNDSQSLFLMNDGTVKICGKYNSNYYSTPTTIANLSNVIQINSNYYSSFALLNNGTVMGWGDNSYNQIDNTDVNPISTPTIVPDLSNVIQISSGENHNAFLLNNGNVIIRGSNTYGQCGNNNGLIDLSLNIKQVACGQYHTLFLLEDGSVKGIGNNSSGILGNPNETDNSYNTPIDVYGSKNVVSIDCGNSHNVLLLDDGSVQTFGQNGSGELGIEFNPPFFSSELKTIIDGSNINASIVCAGLNTTIIYTDTSGLIGYGVNSNGQLGDGTNTNANLGIATEMLQEAYTYSDITTISIDSSNLYISPDGKIIGIGDPSYITYTTNYGSSNSIIFDYTTYTTNDTTIVGNNIEPPYYFEMDYLKFELIDGIYTYNATGEPIDISKINTSEKIIFDIKGVNNAINKFHSITISELCNIWLLDSNGVKTTLLYENISGYNNIDITGDIRIETTRLNIKLSQIGYYTITSVTPSISGKIEFYVEQNPTYENIVSISGEVDYLNFGRSVAINNDGSVYVIGTTDTINNTGKIDIYIDNSLNHTINGDQNNSFLGVNVQLNNDGNILAVSSYESDFRGKVSIYEYDGNNWNNKGQDLSGSNNNDSMGEYVSLNSSGNIIAIGTPYKDKNSTEDVGQVSVYEYDNGTNKWIQKGSSLEGVNQYDSLSRVSLNGNGNILAVTTTGYDISSGQSIWTDEGKVSIYEYDTNSSDWIILGNELIGPSSFSGFGSSLDLDFNGYTLVVGGSGIQNNTNTVGAIIIYKYNSNNNTWEQDNIIYGETVFENFGTIVKINDNGDKILTMSNRRDNNETPESETSNGYIVIYDSSYNKIYELYGNSYDNYGRSIDINNNMDIFIFSGSNYNNNNKGFVKVYSFVEPTEKYVKQTEIIENVVDGIGKEIIFNINNDGNYNFIATTDISNSLIKGEINISDDSITSLTSNVFDTGGLYNLVHYTEKYTFISRYTAVSFYQFMHTSSPALLYTISNYDTTNFVNIKSIDAIYTSPTSYNELTYYTFSDYSYNRVYIFYDTESGARIDISYIQTTITDNDTGPVTKIFNTNNKNFLFIGDPYYNNGTGKVDIYELIYNLNTNNHTINFHQSLYTDTNSFGKYIQIETDTTTNETILSIGNNSHTFTYKYNVSENIYKYEALILNNTNLSLTQTSKLINNTNIIDLNSSLVDVDVDVDVMSPDISYSTNTYQILSQHTYIGVNTTDPSGSLHVRNDFEFDDETNIPYQNSHLLMENSGNLWHFNIHNHNASENHLHLAFNKVSRGYFRSDNDAKVLDFTGQHRNILLENGSTILSTMNKLNGFIVSSTSKFYETVTINNALPFVELSKKQKDKSVFGVISDCEDENENTRKYEQGSFVTVINKESSNDTRAIINSVGEGGMWVCNINGNIENGDYITSSHLPGLGMKQNEEYLANYTVSKATQDIDFTEAKQLITFKELTTERNVNGEYEYKTKTDSEGNIILREKYESKYVEVFSDKYVIYNDTEKTDEYYTYMFDFANGTTEQQSCIGNTYTMAFIGCTYHCG